MENFFKLIHSFISSFSGFLYNPWVPLFLVIGGFYLAFRTKFVQFRLFKESIKVVTEKLGELEIQELSYFLPCGFRI